MKKINEIKKDRALDKTSVVESALRGLAQGATFGFADEISAVAKSATDDFKTYEEAIEEERDLYDAARGSHKAVSIAAESAPQIVLSVLSPLIKSKAVAKAIPNLKNFEQAQALGFLTRNDDVIAGALTGLGHGEGFYDKAALGVGGAMLAKLFNRAGEKVAIKADKYIKKDSSDVADTIFAKAWDKDKDAIGILNKYNRYREVAGDTAVNLDEIIGTTKEGAKMASMFGKSPIKIAIAKTMAIKPDRYITKGINAIAIQQLSRNKYGKD
jgi:hypothetical protein